VDRIEHRIALPVPRKAWTSRHQLLEAIGKAAESKLILIVAGPGYGKTGLLSLYAMRNPNESFAYLSLSKAESEPRVFVQSLARALVKSGALPASHTPRDAQGNPASDVMDLLDEASANCKRLTLILDAFENVDDSAGMLGLVASAGRNLPDNAHLVIASRAMPALKLGALMQDMSIIGQNSFRLTDEEILELISQNASGDASSVRTDLIKKVKTVTGGWLTGARLYAQLLSIVQTANQADEQLDEILSDYFRTETLERISPSLRDFVLQTSLLNQVSAEACEKVLGIENAPALMAETRRQNLFVVDSGEGAQGSFSYAPLFHHFLKSEFARQSPNAHKESLRKIAQDLLRQGMLEQAVQHFIDANEKSIAAELTLTQGDALLKKGNYAQMLGLLEPLKKFIKDDAASRQKLENNVVFCHIRLGNYAAARKILSAPGDEFAENDRAFWRIVLDTHDGNYLAGVNWATHDHPHVPSFAPARIEAVLSVGRCLVECGQLSAALQLLMPTLSDPEILEWKSLHARVRILESDIHDLRGDTALAIRSSAESVALARTSEDNSILIVALLVQARRLMSEGDLSGAERAMTEANRLARQGNYEGLQMRLDQATAWFGLTGGRFDDAIALSKRIISIAHNQPNMPRGISTAIQLDALEMRQRALMLSAMLRKNSQSRLDEFSEAVLVAQEMMRLTEADQSVFWKRKALRTMGAATLMMGDLAPAMAYLKRADDLRGEFWDITAGSVLGWQLFIENSAQDEDAGKRIAKIVSELSELRVKRGSLTFLQQEGEKVWSAYIRHYAADTSKNKSVTDTRPLPPRATSTRVLEPEAIYQPARSRNASDDGSLKVYGFGIGRTVAHGELVTVAQWGWSIPRELLIYMLTVREATRERIGSIFWPDSSTLTMQRGFHNAKFTIRTVIGLPPFLYFNGIYTLNPDVQYWYDVQEFEKLIEESPQLPPERALENLSNAAALYTNDFLEGSGLDWAENTRQRLRARYLKCCLDMGQIAVSLNINNAEVINPLERAFQMEPLREDIARSYMRLLLLAGKKGEAIETYRHLSAALRRELNVRPDEETETLYRSILSEGRQTN